MNNIYLILIIGLIVFGCGKNEPFVWNKNVSFQEILVKSSGKLILMDFETEWWSWCDRLDVDTYSDSKVKAFTTKHFISMKIDAEKGEGIDLAKQYGVRGFPTIIFANDKGAEVDRIIGYRPPETFLKELKRIHSGKNTLPDMLDDFELFLALSLE